MLFKEYLCRFRHIIPITFVALALTACGGDGAGTADGSTTTTKDITVVGTIAGFGSIIMSNGVAYDTDSLTDCNVDDEAIPGTCEESLDVGMKVSLGVNSSGSANSLYYDDDLEGPAANVSGSNGDFTFDIFGVTVVTTASGTAWDDFATNPLDPGELEGVNVEVSGEWQLDTLYATYVEKQDDSTYEIKGIAGSATGSQFPLTLPNDTVVIVEAGGLPVPQEGSYIEVEGTYDDIDDIFNATEIEIEDADSFDSNGEAEITGTLLENADSPTGYSIGNTAVDISRASTCNELVGSVVEAEGVYDQESGILVVATCEDEDDEIEMKCVIGSVTIPDATKPKVGSLECGYPGTTGDPLLIEFHDSPELAEFSGDSSSDPVDLNDFVAGDCAEIEADMDTSGNLVAGMIEKESSGVGCSSYELTGPVEDFTDNVSITVLGITFAVDTGTIYENNLKPEPGDYVEIEDDDANGTADQIEIED